MVKLCACGCGGVIVIKPHHKYSGIPDYIHNHHRKGKHLSQDHKDKISKANKGRKITGQALENMKIAAKDPERNRKISESQMGDKNRMANLESREKMILSLEQFYEDPEAREIQRQNAIEQWSDQDARDEMSRIKKQYYIDHPEEKELNKKRLIQYYIDNPEARDNAREKTLEQFGTQESRERHSAIMKEEDYDAGEWSGFKRTSRQYVKSIEQSIQINKRFKGSEGHHITPSIVMFIPNELHKHIRHNIKTGENMGEMNILALQFINGDL